MATVAPPQQQQQQPPAQQQLPPGGMGSANTDADQEANKARALAGVTAPWRSICGDLLSETEPPKVDKAKFKSAAYQLLALRDGSGQAGLPAVKAYFALVKSRNEYFRELEVLESDAKKDGTHRAAIHECLQALIANAEVQTNVDRILATYLLLSTGGREWWRGDDAKEWVGAYASYLEGLGSDQPTSATTPYDGSNAKLRRKSELAPILNLLKLGALTLKSADAGPAAPAAQGPTVEEKKKWDDDAAALKKEIEPHLPPEGAVGDAAKLSGLDDTQKAALIHKVTLAPLQVRDRLYQDTSFMRRVALLAESAKDKGRFVTTLMQALDPVEGLHDQCTGMTTGTDGRRFFQSSPDGAHRFGLIKGYLLSHPGKEGQGARNRVLAHPGMMTVISGLDDKQNADVMRLITRGTLESTIEDRLMAAAKSDNAQELARCLVTMTPEDRAGVATLQSDLLFRNAIMKEKFREPVVVDGVSVRPGDLILQIWGIRPGATADPGQTGATQDKVTPEDDKPLEPADRLKLDKELYEPAIQNLSAALSAADGWFSGARTSDSTVVKHLNEFAAKCADKGFVSLLRRQGTPPGGELATRYNAKTGKSIHNLIKNGCGDDARRTAERVLNITIDSASVGQAGGAIVRAGEKPEGAVVSLEQALRETKTDAGATVSQAVHDAAAELKGEVRPTMYTSIGNVQKTWTKLTNDVNPKLEEIHKLTGRKVSAIELLQNAYMEIDGPLLAAIKTRPQGTADEVRKILGLTDQDLAAQQAATKPDEKTAQKAKAEEVYGAEGKKLFDAFSGLSRESDKAAFTTAKTQLDIYLALPTHDKKPNPRSGTEAAGDKDPGTAIPPPETAEDYYRITFGITPKNHAVQLARAFRDKSKAQNESNFQRPDGDRTTPDNPTAPFVGDVAKATPETVAEWLGIDKALVTGPVAAPPDSEKPAIDERNAKMVRPGFTLATAEKNAADIWKLLHGGGEVHLIQTMLYGPYNDEEQRLIRLAFRQLSGGIDWHFYIQQARAAEERKQKQDHSGMVAGGGTDKHQTMLGGEGTAAGQALTKDKEGNPNTVITITGDKGELDAALQVATQGELDIRGELRNARKVNDIFRIVDRADDAQCKKILADQQLMAELKTKLMAESQSAWDRVYRVLTGQASLNDMLESRSHGEVDSAWEGTFGGTDEKGMEEDVKTYIHKMRLKFEADELRKAKENNSAPAPEQIQLNVAVRLRQACQKLMANPETQKILEEELGSKDLSNTQGLILNGGKESNVAALTGEASADDIIAEIKRMPKAERDRRLKDPEYMSRLGKAVTGEKYGQAMALLQSPEEGPPGEQGAVPGVAGSGADKFAELVRATTAEEALKALTELTPADHQRLLDDPALLRRVLDLFKYESKERRELAQRIVGYRKEDADKTLGKDVLEPGGTSSGIPETEKQRLAFLQENAVHRLEEGGTLSWNELVRQAVEVFKMDFVPKLPEAKPAAGESDKPVDPAAQKATSPIATKMSEDIRKAIWTRVESKIGAQADDATKKETIHKAVIGSEDPTLARIQNAHHTVLPDDDADIEDAIKQASPDLLIKDWTSIKEGKIKPTGDEPMQAVYKKYRDSDEKTKAKGQNATEADRAATETAKLQFMNYVIDVSNTFEDQIVVHGPAGGAFDEDSETDKKAGRSRTAQRKNPQYNKWRAIIRSRIPELPKQKIAAAIGAMDRPDDVALIENPNRTFHTAREFREDEYLQKFGTADAGARVAAAERAAVNDTMGRYGREGAQAETNKEGDHGIITEDEMKKLAKSGEDVDKAMQAFSAKRAEIAAVSAALVGFVVGAALTVLTGGAGAGVAWMLVAGAVSGAAGAAGSAITKKAIQGSDYDMSHEGMETIAEGAIVGMISAGTTRMASSIMGSVTNQASLSAQAKAVDAITQGAKPTVWQQLAAGAGGLGKAAGENIIQEGLTSGIDVGLVPIDPRIWTQGWNEGVIKAQAKIRAKIDATPKKLLSSGIVAALMHGGGAAINKGKDLVLTPKDKEAVTAKLEAAQAAAKAKDLDPTRIDKNLDRYMKIDEIALQAFSSFAAGRISEAAEGKPVNWDNVPNALFMEFINAWGAVGAGIHGDSKRLGQERAEKVKEQIEKHGALLTGKHEKTHYKSINPEVSIAEIITVEKYLAARKGMFEAAVAHWEAEHHPLSPGQREVFEQYCRDAVDSVEYAERLKDPRKAPGLDKVGYTAKKPETLPAPSAESHEPGPKPKPQPEPKPEPPKPPPSPDELAKMTGASEAMSQGTYTGKARTEGEPDVVAQEIMRSVPLVATHFKGTVEVASANVLRVKVGDTTLLVQVTPAAIEGNEVARYRFTTESTAVIEVSDRARDKHVERAVSDLVAEMQAIREAQLQGKPLPKENALKAGSKATELSAEDIGHIAQLQAVLRQLGQAQAQPNPNSVVLKQLGNDITMLQDSMGLLGEVGAQRRKTLVEPRLTPEELKALREMSGTKEDMVESLADKKALPEQHAHADGSVPIDSVLTEHPETSTAERAKQIADLKAIIDEVAEEMAKAKSAGKEGTEPSIKDLRDDKRSEKDGVVTPGDQVLLVSLESALGHEKGIVNRLYKAKLDLQQAKLDPNADPVRIRTLTANVISVLREYRQHLVMRKPDYARYAKDVKTGLEFFRRYKMITGHGLTPREIADTRASAPQLGAQELRVGIGGDSMKDTAALKELSKEFNQANDEAHASGDKTDVSLIVNTTKKKSGSPEHAEDMAKLIDEWGKDAELKKAVSGLDNAGVESAKLPPSLLWKMSAKRAFMNAETIKGELKNGLPAEQREAFLESLARVIGGDKAAAKAALDHFESSDYQAGMSAVDAKPAGDKIAISDDGVISEAFAGMTMEQVARTTREITNALRAHRAETGDARQLPKLLGYTVHAGEQLKDMDPFQLLKQVEEAINLGADRIGHGLILGIDAKQLQKMGKLKADEVDTFVARQEQVRNHAKQAGVTIEMNITSNTEISNLSGKEHPAGKMVKSGLKVSVSTDDETTLGTTVKDELRRLAATPSTSRTDVAIVILEGFYSRMGIRELSDRGRLKSEYLQTLMQGLNPEERMALAKALADRFYTGVVKDNAEATIQRVLNAVFGTGG